MHGAVAFLQIGRGLADPGAAVGEHLGDLVDGAAEAPREETPARHMKPRLGLAAALVDGKGVGFEDCGAQTLHGSGNVRKRARSLARQNRVTVAAGDLVGDGRKSFERLLDKKRARQRRDDTHGKAGDGARRDDGESGHRAGKQYRKNDKSARQRIATHAHDFSNPSVP